MENSKILIPTFFLFTLIGMWIISDSWGGITYVYTGDGDRRLPAAIGKGMDFSQLKGDALFMASKARVIEEAIILHDKSNIGLELGHFLTRDHNGQKQFACKKYPKVILKFTAVGTAESGEPPVMEIETDCKIGESVSKIAPIWIPSQLLLNEKPANMEFKINEPQEMDFRFDHIGTNWPKIWALNSVHLRSEKSGESLSIDHNEIRGIREKPIEILW